MPRPPVKASQLSPNPGSASCRHAGVELNLPESPPLWPPSPRGAAGLPQPPSLRTPQASHTQRMRPELVGPGGGTREGLHQGWGHRGCGWGRSRPLRTQPPPHRQGTAVPGEPSGAQDGPAPRGSSFFLCWGRPPSFSSTPGAAPDSENHFSDAASPAKPGCVPLVRVRCHREAALALARAVCFALSAICSHGGRQGPQGAQSSSRPRTGCTSTKAGGELRFSRRGSDRHLPGGGQVPPPAPGASCVPAVYSASPST